MDRCSDGSIDRSIDLIDSIDFIDPSIQSPSNSSLIHLFLYLFMVLMAAYKMILWSMPLDAAVSEHPMAIIAESSTIVPFI